MSLGWNSSLRFLVSFFPIAFMAGGPCLSKFWHRIFSSFSTFPLESGSIADTHIPRINFDLARILTGWNHTILYLYNRNKLWVKVWSVTAPCHQAQSAAPGLLWKYHLMCKQWRAIAIVSWSLLTGESLLNILKRFSNQNTRKKNKQKTCVTGTITENWIHSCCSEAISAPLYKAVCSPWCAKCFSQNSLHHNLQNCHSFLSHLEHLQKAVLQGAGWTTLEVCPCSSPLPQTNGFKVQSCLKYCVHFWDLQ